MPDLLTDQAISVPLRPARVKKNPYRSKLCCLLIVRGDSFSRADKSEVESSPTPTGKAKGKRQKSEVGTPEQGTGNSQQSGHPKSFIQNQERLVTVNVKITKAQKDWLAETASQVRDNNLEPVPPALRVYPQHLIGVAIDLLQAAEVDWDKVKSIGDLREQLNI